MRRARPEELPGVGELTVAAYAEFTQGEADPYLARLRDAAGRDRDAEVWVAADDDGPLLGTVTVCPSGSPWREIARPDEGEFRMLAVAPGARGRGVGQRLVELVLDRFRREGCTAVVLSSLAEMSSAHRLYARLGFARLPERDWSPVPGVDLISFWKELGPCPTNH